LRHAEALLLPRAAACCCCAAGHADAGEETPRSPEKKSSTFLFQYF
jgi:hypothetical protein